jgi:hypothetical protein
MDSSGIHFQIGLWLQEEEEKSSDYKELTNLGDMVSEEAMARRFKDCKIFIFTDNFTAEEFFCRGNS